MKKMVVTSKEDYSQISYILGIISIVLAFFTPLAALIFGIIGVVIGKKQNTSLSEKGRKYSKIGIILSIILIILSIAVQIFLGTNTGIINNFPAS
jgi:hypothetical protein